MGLNELKCNNCGAILKLDENGQLICPHCGSLYAETEENNNYITNHNETTVNNYYGAAIKTSINKNQTEGFFELLTDAFADGYYSDAFSYCNKILNYDPTDSEALLVKKYLQEYRLSVRKFFKHSLYQIIINVIEYDFLGDKPENRRHLIKLIDKLISKLITISNMDAIAEYNFACIASLQKYVDNKNCYDGEFIELKEKTDNLYLQLGKNIIDKKEKQKQQRLQNICGIVWAILGILVFFNLSELGLSIIAQLQSKIILNVLFLVLEIGVLIISIIIYKKLKGNNR